MASKLKIWNPICSRWEWICVHETEEECEGGGIENVVEDTTPQLGGDLDCQNYKAIAMACDNGETLPSDPVIGQWFLHTPTGRSILMQYNGSTWSPIISFGTMTLYVDKTDGTDDQAHGTGVDANAFKTIQYAVNTIPGLVGGNVTININAETYAENVVINSKQFTGNYTINVIGTLTALATATQDSSVQGATTTMGSITDTGAFTGYADKLLYSSNNAEYRIIDSVTANTATIVGYWTSAPTGNYTVYDWGTVITNISITNQIGVRVNYVKATTVIGVNSSFSLLRSWVTSGGDSISGNSVILSIDYSLLQTSGAWAGACNCGAGSNLIVCGCKFTGSNTDSILIWVNGVSILAMYSQPSVLDGSVGNKAKYGIYLLSSASATMGYIYNIIRYCDVGINALYGAMVYGTSANVYSNNGANETASAATYCYID